MCNKNPYLLSAEHLHKDELGFKGHQSHRVEGQIVNVTKPALYKRQECVCRPHMVQWKMSSPSLILRLACNRCIYASWCLLYTLLLFFFFFSEMMYLVPHYNIRHEVPYYWQHNKVWYNPLLTTVSITMYLITHHTVSNNIPCYAPLYLLWCTLLLITVSDIMYLVTHHIIGYGVPHYSVTM